MWQIMWGYLIIVKIVAKTRPTCKCYMDGQKPNMYMLIVYILHVPFGDVVLNHDLQLDVGSKSFIIETNVFLLMKTNQVICDKD